MITTIGLEIHAELLTATKIFCACPNTFGSEPNTNVCPICLGQPGTLPDLNQKAVELSVRAGIATNCEIHEVSGFDRKNYMYPDLPKAYQITQFFRPIATNGYLEIQGKKIRIREIHMEEDAGKLTYAPNGEIWVDYNRCGVPLIEIVTEPDMESAQQAEAFARELNLILRYAGVCDGHMEQGSFRVDVNVSVRENPEDPLGERTEIKNLNSYRSLRNAIVYEAARQEKLISQGTRVERETRRFSQETGETILMRSKESLEDYRYFPDPDVPDVRISKDQMECIRSGLPELPEHKRKRWGDHLTEEQKQLLCSQRQLADYYDAVVHNGAQAQLSAAVLLREGLRLAKETGIEEFSQKLSPARCAQIIELLAHGRIMRSVVEELMAVAMETTREPALLAEELGLVSAQEEDWLQDLIETVLMEEAQSVAAYHAGKVKMEKYLMGQIMRRAGKKADPRMVLERLHQKLNG